MALVPGLVNGHTHAAMTLFRGHGDDRPLMEWLEEVIWPVEASLDRRRRLLGDSPGLRGDDPDRNGPVLGHVLARRAPRRARSRTPGFAPRSARSLIDVGDAAGEGPAPRGRGARPGGDRRARELVRPALAPHAIYTVSEPSLRWIAEASEERGLPVQIHLSETEEEVTRCVSEHSVRPAAVPRAGRIARAANGAGPRRLAGRRGAGADRRRVAPPWSPIRSPT